MSNTIPYTVITDTMKKVIGAEILRLIDARDTAVKLDVITEDEANTLQENIDTLREVLFND